MKQKNFHKILLIILLSSLIIICSLLCLTIIPFSIPLNNLSQSHTHYPEKLGFPINSQTITKKCEIIITSEDKDYINQLKLTYPNCKIIKKAKLYKFNLIDKLLSLFD